MIDLWIDLWLICSVASFGTFIGEFGWGGKYEVDSTCFALILSLMYGPLMLLVALVFTKGCENGWSLTKQ